MIGGICMDTKKKIGRAVLIGAVATLWMAPTWIMTKGLIWLARISHVSLNPSKAMFFSILTIYGITAIWLISVKLSKPKQIWRLTYAYLAFHLLCSAHLFLSVDWLKNWLWLFFGTILWISFFMAAWYGVYDECRKKIETST